MAVGAWAHEGNLARLPGAQPRGGFEIVDSAPGRNARSLRVLHKSGFKIIGTEISCATARRGEIEETILRLDS
jgi:hypothetical protein